MKIPALYPRTLLLLATLTGAARADLQTVGIWNGNVGLSIDAVGGNGNPVGNLQAQIPTGSTILAAYLYSVGTPHPWYADSPTSLADYNGAGITLAGNAVTNFSTLVGATALPARPDLGTWYTGRADVTTLVQSLAFAGPDYTWTVTEGSLLNTRIDGELLAIVYSNPSLPLGSVALLDGGQNTNGETTTVNFGAPLGAVGDPAFFADMSLGISFSLGAAQTSRVDINGARLTTAAGGPDDGVQVDGGLITAGGIGDSTTNPADPLSSSSADDELYDLTPYLTTGVTSFTIFTQNPSNDDNVFFMGLRISGEIRSINEPTTPRVPDSGLTAGLLLGACGALAALRRRLLR